MVVVARRDAVEVFRSGRSSSSPEKSAHVLSNKGQVCFRSGSDVCVSSAVCGDIFVSLAVLCMGG